MKFCFRDAPAWFTNYVCEIYLDEFHTSVRDKFQGSGFDPQLLDAAVEFFSQKGFRVCCINRQLWFDIDDSAETTWLTLKYQD